MSGAGTAALDIDRLNLAAGHPYSAGAIAKGAEVDGEWAGGGVEFAEGANTVAGAGGEDGEVRLRGELVGAFEFGRSDEPDAEICDGLGGGS